MSIKYKSNNDIKNSNLNMKSNYENIFSFNNDSQFKLLITTQPLQKINNFKFFSKLILAGENNTYFFKNISPEEVIQNISEKSITNNIQSLTSFNYNTIFKESNIKIKVGEKNEYYINPEIKLNITSPEKYSTKNGDILLIKFDLKDNENPFYLQKNNVNNTFLCSLNGNNNNGENNLCENGISFNLEIQKIVKSIQIRLEDLKQKGIKILNDEIFLQIHQTNMGIIISQNPDNQKLNLETMKTNFNSIAKQKFILKSIFIAFNLSLSSDNGTLKANKIENNLINDSENNEKKSDSVNEEMTSCGSSSNYNSPKISGSEKDPQDNNNKKNLKYNKFNLHNVLGNDSNFNDRVNLINNNFRKINSYRLNHIYNSTHTFTNVFFKPKSKKKNYYKQQYNDFIFNGNVTFLNSSDIFSKTLFNRYLDKSNSTCNYKILTEFLEIKLNHPISELTIYKFFNSFTKISYMSLKIPFFKTDGGIIQKTLTPSLKEIKLIIKNSKLLKKIKKKFSQKLSPINSFGEEIILDINGFDIYILESESLIKIIYNEERPYYLRESLSYKLEQLMDISKSIKKINIEKDVIINKSYMNVEWNFISCNNIFSSSFISCYSFNSNLLGIISNIMEKEFNFWINNVEERINKVYVDYRNIIYENNKNALSFINNTFG